MGHEDVQGRRRQARADLWARFVLWRADVCLLQPGRQAGTAGRLRPWEQALCPSSLSARSLSEKDFSPLRKATDRAASLVRSPAAEAPH